MNIPQYREHIVRLTLMHLGLHSPEAETLVLGTAIQESGGLKYIRQLGNGPAMGFIQMEAATHNDIWDNFLRYRPKLSELVLSASGLKEDATPSALTLIGNMAYGAAMCRIHYLRQPGKVPRTLEGQAVYWKKYYNTHLGKGTVDEYIRNWSKYVA